MSKRDYDLLGPSGQRAIDIGLAAAEWYHTDVPRKEMKALMKRSDQPAIRDTAIYYGAMIVFAFCAIALMPSWWSLPFWIAYATLYTSGADSRWHEAGHGTAFKTGWMNTFVYQVACFMLFRNPTLWRWSHARHHTDTIIVGRDPEIITMRPPAMFKLWLLVIGQHTFDGFIAMFRHASEGLNASEKSFTPESEWGKAQRVARIWIVIVAGVVLAAMSMQSFIPFLLVGVGPAILGSWHLVLTGLLQHTGMADNVIDHRLNTRTVYMNPISRFIYWNMNYHIEHHMFPMVPYHALPKLHETIKDDLPVPSRGFFDGMGEVISALWKQLSDPEFRIEKELPETAQPYRMDLHDVALDVPAE
ncbi:MAG: fatty acid desaturase family protein [Paracoccaceae bacterium]